MSTSINIKGIFKSYDSVKALNDISLDINQGELFGLIGADGAGKTTLFRLLATLLLPDAGSIDMEGYDVVNSYKKIRNLLGYMPGRFSLYQDLSVMENLNFFATVFNTKIEENIDLIEDIWKQIEPFKDRKAGKLSGGMKQKLALCCALIHKPKVLLLDEPTTGVDAVSRSEFWQILKKIQQYGITIVVATPYMDEATLCDRVALLDKGAILQVDTPQGVVSTYRKALYAITGANIYDMMLLLRKYEFTESVFAFGQELHYTDKRDEFDTNQLQHYLKEALQQDVLVRSINPNIEDCFMALSIQKNK
ncbi:ABC transporter ATP-binding protein [Puteibacter caeruleilacunae]|nr:ABC transporter ATP-binding protein [Puteibacter caeruleilacunae]